MSDSEKLKKKLGDLSQFSNKFIKNLLNIIDENNNLNETIEKQLKCIYNCRDNSKNIWNYMTEVELLQSKLINSIYDIKYRSRFINNTNVLMSDWIMFNKYNIKYYQIDRLLNYCKFKRINNNTYQLDGWIFREISQNDDGLWYNIEYTNNYPDKYLNNDTDKRQIMNESPKEFINFNNYYLIGSYENKNDAYLQSWTINTYKIEKVLDKKYNNGKMTQMEIIETLYDHTINGSNDFRKNHGDQRFLQVIDSILYTTKYRYNCGLLSKEDVLMVMYNTGNPCGMGIIEMNNNKMSLEEAEQLLKQQYFGYIKGIPIKTSFKMYPIIDYRKYDNYHGKDTFLKCIKKLNNNEQIKKVQISKELISRTIKNMLK